jgi:iron complex transport system ATP-binding protein
MLQASGLSFAYGKKKILQEVSLELRPREVVGVVGPNGAGKSTLIKLLTKLLVPSSGTITLNHQDVQKLGRLELARQLAVLPQGGDLPFDYRVYDLVMMGRTPHLGFLARETKRDHDLVQGIMQRTDTWQFRERFASDLSGGEKQRVLLAKALAQEPSYLLLDEPTNHLDLKYQVEGLLLVRQEVERGLGALIVLHDLNLAARVCDRILILQQGSVVAEGKPNEILTESLLKNVYGTNISVLQQGSSPVIIPNI